MNEETTVTLGASILSLAMGWAVRHFHLFNLAPAPAPNPTPVPVPIPAPSAIESRLDALEKQLAILIAALSRPQTPVPSS